MLARFQPQMVWYLAGVDPYEGDRLGRMFLSLEGLRQRDAYVLSICRQGRIPVVITMGGGYAPQIDDIVEAHCQTIRLACQLALDATGYPSPTG
jgi:acetoin utilization deacetylase AcuC-like enzyme